MAQRRRQLTPEVRQLLQEAFKPVAPPPPPEPGMVQKYLPPALRGIGMLLGITPARGAGASGLAELAAQGVEGRFSPAEIGVAAVTGGVGGAATKSILSNLSKPLVAMAKGAAWGGASPLAREASGKAFGSEDDYEASPLDVAVGAGIGGSVAGGLAKLLGRFQPRTPVTPTPEGPMTLQDFLASKTPKDIEDFALRQDASNLESVGRQTREIARDIGKASPASLKTLIRDQKAEAKAAEAAKKQKASKTAIDAARAGMKGPQSVIRETVSAEEGPGKATLTSTWKPPKSKEPLQTAGVRTISQSISDVPPKGTPAGQLFDEWMKRGATPGEASRLAAEGQFPPGFRPAPAAAPPQIYEELLAKIQAEGRAPTPSVTAPAAPEVPPAAPESGLLNFFKTPADAVGAAYRGAKADPTANPLAVRQLGIGLGEEAGKIGLPSRVKPGSLQKFLERDLGPSIPKVGSGAAPVGKVPPTGILEPPRAIPEPILSPEGPTPIRSVGELMERWVEEVEKVKALGVTDPAKVDEATHMILKQLMDENPEVASGFGSRLGGESGEIALPLLAKLGFAAGGAAIGGATDPFDDPLTSAMAGGAAGYSIPSLINLAQKASTRLAADPGVPSGIRAIVQPLAEGNPEVAQQNFWRQIPNIFRSGMLTSPNAVNNFFVGPWGSGMSAGLELRLAGDPRGARILAEMTPANWAKEYGKALPQAQSLILNAEAVAKERIEGVPQGVWRILQGPAVGMMTGDIATRNILIRSGLPEELARRYTLTSEPVTKLVKAIINFQRTTGPAGQLLLPFARTIGNIAEQSAARAPILGQFLQKAHPELAYPEVVQQAQQTIGTAVPLAAMGLGYISPEEDTVGGRLGGSFLRSATSNVAGPYSGLASIGFGMGKALQQPSSRVGDVAFRGVTEGLETLPLPTTDLPMSWGRALRDLLNGKLPNRVPSGIPVSGVINAQLQEQGRSRTRSRRRE